MNICQRYWLVRASSPSHALPCCKPTNKCCFRWTPWTLESLVSTHSAQCIYCHATDLTVLSCPLRGCFCFVFSRFSHVQLFYDPKDCSLPGSSVQGRSKARILEWVAISFSRGSSQPRDRTGISCIAGRFLTAKPPGKPYLEGALSNTQNYFEFFLSWKKLPPSEFPGWYFFFFFFYKLCSN